MKVAVRRVKHSVRFGQASDSQTEWRSRSRRRDFTSWRSRRFSFFSRIQAGRRAVIEMQNAKCKMQKQAAIDFCILHSAFCIRPKTEVPPRIGAALELES